MRFSPLLLVLSAVVAACGSSDAETTGSDTTTASSSSSAGTLEMRDSSSGPSSSGGELGQLETTSSPGEAVATDRTEGESRPSQVDTDPLETREGEVPLTPSQRERNRIFRAVEPDIERCLRGLHVRFRVRLRVVSSGIVREALVEGEHIEGSDRAECIQGIFRNVMFPAFRDPDATMRHDYRF